MVTAGEAIEEFFLLCEAFIIWYNEICNYPRNSVTGKGLRFESATI